MEKTAEKQSLLDKWIDALKPGKTLNQRLEEHPVITTVAAVAGSVVLTGAGIVVGLGGFLVAASFPLATTLALGVGTAALLATTSNAEGPEADAKVLKNIAEWREQDARRERFTLKLKDIFGIKSARALPATNYSLERVPAYKRANSIAR